MIRKSGNRFIGSCPDRDLAFGATRVVSEGNRNQAAAAIREFRAASARALAPPGNRSKRSENQVSVYFDTKRLKLKGSGLTLRADHQVG